MASPPYSSYSPSALSPPYPSHSQLPAINTSGTMSSKKRPSDGGAGPSALKRRKASTMSVTSATSSHHPLRQTSFPPEDASAAFDARSPSVADDAISLVSGSQVSASVASAAAPAKKKRGRKSKADKAREQTPSVAGGRAATSVSGRGGRGGDAAGAGGGEGGEGEEGEDEEDEGPVTSGGKRTEEEKLEEARLRATLISHFDDQQFERYENWRAAGLGKAAVRRVINSLVSQSVNENIVLAVKSVAKVYLGDIIELARKVQQEWIRTGEEQVLKDDFPTGHLTPPSSAESPAGVNGEAVHIEGTGGDEPLRDMRAGPLRPAHLQEALRRYRLANRGGGAGTFSAWNQQQQGGIERFGGRTGGKRLFK